MCELEDFFPAISRRGRDIVSSSSVHPNVHVCVCNNVAGPCICILNEQALKDDIQQC